MKGTKQDTFVIQSLMTCQVREICEGKSSFMAKTNLFLTMVCKHRTVDLAFETLDDKSRWRNLLAKLVAKEKGILDNVMSIHPQEPGGFDEFKHTDVDNDLEWFALYGGIGSHMLNTNVRTYLCELSI